MTNLTVTKKLKIFNRDDIQEAIQYITTDGYFANSIDEFKDTALLFTLDHINITDMYDMNVFICDDGSYELFAIIEE